MIKIAKHFSEVWEKFVPKEKFILVYVKEVQTEPWRYQTIRELKVGMSISVENYSGETYYD